MVHVEDSGPGMSEEEQKKLFKSSWQGELGKTAPSGTGLGLYLCQQIVKAHRGEISCHSTLGKGTTFTVELPVAPLAVQEEAKTSVSKRKAKPSVSPCTAHILLAPESPNRNSLYVSDPVAALYRRRPRRHLERLDSTLWTE